MVGGVFFGAGVREKAAHGGALKPCGSPGGEFTASGSGPGGDGQCGAKPGGGAGVARINRAAHQMAIGDMGRLMGDHGLQHRRGLHPQDQPGMNEHAIGIDHEGVQVRIVDHQNIHPVRA